MGHARALLALDAARQIEAGTRVAAKRLSVRETEALVQSLLRGPAARAARGLTAISAAGRGGCRSASAPRSRSVRRKRARQIVLHYSSLDHLEQLLKRLK